MGIERRDDAGHRGLRSGARALVGLLALAFACGGEPPRVALVDVQQVFQRSPLAMVAAHGIKKELGGAQSELKKRGRALAELRQQFEHGGLELDDAERSQMEEAIAAETTRLVELQQRYRADLAAAQQRQHAELVARIEEVARKLATREGFTLLVRSDGVLYRDEEAPAGYVDLTEPVAREFLAKINPTEIPAAPAEPESEREMDSEPQGVPSPGES